MGIEQFDRRIGCSYSAYCFYLIGSCIKKVYFFALYWVSARCLLIRESQLMVLLVKYAYIKEEDGGYVKGESSKIA